MIKKIWPALFLFFCEPGIAYPLILKLSNLQKQNLHIYSGSEVKFSIAPEETKEIVLLQTNDYLARYSPDNLIGKLKWVFEKRLDVLVSECLESKKDPALASLSICQLQFEKVSNKKDCKNCYDFLFKSFDDTAILEDDFVLTLKNFIGDHNLLSPQNELISAREVQKRHKEIEENLSKAGVLAEFQKAIRSREKLSSNKENKTANVVVFGDQGTGDNNAIQVARDMFAYCKIRGCDVAIGTGDNIYPKAPSIKAVNWEKEFVDKFVKIYSPLWYRLQFPFFLTLGNHDIGVDALIDTDWVYFQRFRKPRTAEHYLTQRVYRINAQTEFTYSESNPKTDELHMWNMPSSKYFKNLKINNKTAFLVSLDTNYFPGEIGENGEPPDGETQKDVQKQWLEQRFKEDQAQKANWRIVFGHHPLFSIGRHGVNTGKLGFSANDLQDMKDLRGHLLPILCENKVDFYLAGHDHHVQIDMISCEGSNHKIVHIISGAAAKKEAESAWGEYVPLSSNAFSAKALYPEFLWGNGLTKAEIEKGAKAKRMFGFAMVQLGDEEAKVEMIESTKEGPILLACFSIGRQSAVGPSCSKDDQIAPLFLTSEQIQIIPPLIKTE